MGLLDERRRLEREATDLRRKLADDPADPRFVFTVRGVGYRMGSGE